MPIGSVKSPAKEDGRLTRRERRTSLRLMRPGRQVGRGGRRLASTASTWPRSEGAAAKAPRSAADRSRSLSTDRKLFRKQQLCHGSRNLSCTERLTRWDRAIEYSLACQSDSTSATLSAWLRSIHIHMPPTAKKKLFSSFPSLVGAIRAVTATPSSSRAVIRAPCEAAGTSVACFERWSRSGRAIPPPVRDDRHRSTSSPVRPLLRDAVDRA